MATSSTESSVSCDQKPREPANDIRHPRWPLWPDTPPDVGLVLPELKGEDNFDSWDIRVLGTLRRHGLEGFVKGTEIPPPSDTPEDRHDLQTFIDRRICAYHIIYNSTKPIHSELILVGYGTDELLDDPDPKALWDAIHRWDVTSHLHISAKVDLVRELSHIHHSQFDNLLEFKRRAEWLRCRLERAGVTINDELMKTYVLSGLRNYPDEWWTTFLFMEASDWTYLTLSAKIEIKAATESLRKCQVAPSKPQHIKKRRNARERRPGQRDRARQRVSRY